MRNLPAAVLAAVCLCLPAWGQNDRVGQPAAAPVQSPVARSPVARLDASGELPALDRSATLAGPDADHNGIRDDIDRYLAEQRYSSRELAAARQLARAYQRAVTVDPADRSAVSRVADAVDRGIDCTGDVFGDSARLPDYLEAYTANTIRRAANYVAYDAALDGTSSAYSPNSCE